MSDCAQTSTDELRELKALIRDLGACLSLPALWASAGPVSIAQGLLDVLVSILRADIAYIRLNHPDGGESFEAARPETGLSPDQIGKLFHTGAAPSASVPPPLCVPNFLGAGTLKIARSRLGLQDEGVVVVAAARGDFPTETDSFLLGAIVNQAVLSLRTAKHVEQLASAASENARLYRQSVEIQRALQGSEERYRKLLGLLPVALYSCEAPSGIITYYNQHAVRLWGRAPKFGDKDERFCGSFKLWRPDGQPLQHEEAPMAVALCEGREFRNEQVMIERPDGTRITVLVNIDPIRDDQGQVTGAINAFHDITALKDAEEALRQADKRKDEFLAMLGHELRNPLGVISTVVQLWRKKNPSVPELQRFQRTIEAEVSHLARLLDDLLDVSRIARGLIRLNKEPCDLTMIVRQVAEGRRPILEASGLDLSIKLPLRPVWVMGDRTRLAQIVGNLLDNANKFTDVGGHVAVEVVQPPIGGSAKLTVCDTGIGMERETLKQLFQPFTQADHDIARSRGGLGLGLALVKGLADLHGAEVRAWSNGVGRGAEFTVQLPLTAEPAPEPGTSDTVSPEPKNGRILIVEDNLAAAESLRRFLAEIGHTVEIALDGKKGIEAARRFRPEIVLCDIGLPEVNGYSVARALRHEPTLIGACLIALSGYGQEDDQRRALEVGFDAYLTKPINLEKLQQLLNSRSLNK